MSGPQRDNRPRADRLRPTGRPSGHDHEQFHQGKRVETICLVWHGDGDAFPTVRCSPIPQQSGGAEMAGSRRTSGRFTSQQERSGVICPSENPQARAGVGGPVPRPGGCGMDRQDANRGARTCRDAQPPYNSAVGNAWQRLATDVDADERDGRKSRKDGRLAQLARAHPLQG